jgi:glutamate formiminotransferase/formiminotetrahydrofolate cyclodeaminase
MPQKLIECIPNFSEGRRQDIIEAIKLAISEVPGILVLDTHSDTDHNRTVITFAGPAQPVAEAAFASIAKSAELIDLDEHRGEHPRIGAADVVPFVPLMGSTMNECIELARSVGKRVGEELGIPVYLYEKAASRPERSKLEELRQGGYEALKEAVKTDPSRKPDFGPAELGKSGATVIGARPPLIAFNVFLNTDNVDIAKSIARTVRHSSGGLRFVKALGLLVDGQAQISMNLTDYTSTPIAHAVEMIRREAHRYGLAIKHSELVGLIPEAALVDAATWFLQLDGFETNQILEKRLFDMTEGEIGSEPSFLSELADGTPTPGGGSAAAYSAAMAAALVAMVARLTLDKKRYSDVKDRMDTIITEADALRESLERATILDAEAYDAVMQAHRLPKKTKAEKTTRDLTIESATAGAAMVPLKVAMKAVNVLRLAVEVAENGNVHAAADVGSAFALANAALVGAGINVRVNAGNVKDREAAESWLKEINRLEKQADELQEVIRGTLKLRGGLEL